MGMGLVPFYSTLETAKSLPPSSLAPSSLAPSNVKGHGKVPYQKPQLKFMEAAKVYGGMVYEYSIVQCISSLLYVNSV